MTTETIYSKFKKVLDVTFMKPYFPGADKLAFKIYYYKPNCGTSIEITKILVFFVR